jgi:aldehyde:ferredoxin oxidoreductase
VNVTNAFGSLPTRNNRQVQFEGAWNISDEAQIETLPDGHSNLITNSACFACTIGCGRVSHIHPNHFSVKDRPEYRIASGGLEFEAAYALGSMVGVDDIDAATFAGFMCNEHGMDPISLGGSIAAAMELFEEGVITTKETGGLELRFGDAEALVRVSEMIGKGEGFGQDIGLGSKRLCEKYGRPEFSMTVKGQEFAGYDSRAQQGMGLGYATSNRGACHMRANVYEKDFATTEIDGKAKIVKESQDLMASIDSSGLCMFPQEIGLEANYIADLMNAACEGDWNLARMRECGERTWNLERQFNLAAGFTAKHDTLPKRLLETPAPSGTAKGLVSRLPEMLPEYYALRGWTPDGQPADATLRRLDL